MDRWEGVHWGVEAGEDEWERGDDMDEEGGRKG